MKSFCFFVMMLFASSKVFTQEIGVWKNYTDMRNVKEISLSGNNVWAATEGGVFKYDLSADDFDTFTKSEGFSSQNITAVDIDANGNIWVGSQEGFINIYNPSDNSIKKILDISSTDKTLKQINNILIDGSNVYVSSDFGLSVINSETFAFNETVLKFENFVSETKVNKTSIGNTIYVTTESGIAVLKTGATNLSAPESWVTYSLGSQITADEVYEVLEFQGSLIASTDKGVFRLTNNIWDVFLFNQQEIKDISVNGDFLYVLLSNGLYKITNSGDEFIYNSPNTILNSVFVQNEQNIFIASANGIKYLTNNNVEEIIPNGPGSNSFQNLTVDTDGNLWAGSGKDLFGAGIFKFDGNEWTIYNTTSNPELITNAYHKAYAAPNGKVYLSNWGNGFAEFANGAFTSYNASNTDLVGVSENTNFIAIDAIQNDLNNNTWLINFLSNNAKPLSVHTADGQWFHFSFPNPSINSTEECILLAIDRNNTKWFAVQKGTVGLYYYNEKNTFNTLSDDSYGFINSSNGLNASDVKAIVVDQRGEIWVGTSVGVDVITNPSNPTSGIRQALPVRFESISCIAVDPINQKWIGTQNGIYVLTSDGVRVVAEYSSSNSPLPTNTIRSITFDEKKGIAYIGTDFGLSTLTTPSIEPNEQFGELFVFPNPFIIEGQSNEQITIDGLIQDSQIKILSITGNLIKEFASPGGRVAFWDGRDLNGDLVTSGVYIIVAYDAEATSVAKSKVAVIRK